MKDFMRSEVAPATLGSALMNGNGSGLTGLDRVD
jgi:hypothetical protein